MKASRVSEKQILGILKQREAERTVADVCREVGISPATFYQWKAKFGGMSVSNVQKLRQPEAENAKLRRVVGRAELRFPLECEHAHITRLREFRPAPSILTRRGEGAFT